MNIGIIGAGGIGSYYAGLMSRAGHSVRLIARGAHLDAIRSNGLEVKTPGESFVARPEATDDGDALSGVDFVVVSVKSYSLADVAPAMIVAANSGAALVPLLNGVDAAQRIEATGVPRDAIVGGLVAVSVFRTAPGKVERRSPFDRMVIGELDGPARDRTRKIVEAFTTSGVQCVLSENITHDLWRKFALIVPMNVGSGLARGPMGRMLATERGRALIAGSLREIVQISRAAGPGLSDDDETQLRDQLLTLPPGTTPSFLADLERGGPTELDALTGAVSRLGKQYGIPTPIHDVATAAFEAATTTSSRA